MIDISGVTVHQDKIILQNNPSLYIMFQNNAPTSVVISLTRLPPTLYLGCT
jgi:hypothetical protein